MPQFGLARAEELPQGKATRPVAVLVKSQPRAIGDF